MLENFTKALIENKTYSQLDRDIDSLLHKIRQIIPNEKFHLLENLESLYNIQESIAESISYAQGLKDGKKINNAN